MYCTSAAVNFAMSVVSLSTGQKGDAKGGPDDFDQSHYSSLQLHLLINSAGFLAERTSAGRDHEITAKLNVLVVLKVGRSVQN
jgi:hypothetical protein